MGYQIVAVGQQVPVATSDKGQIKETDDKDSQPPIEKTVYTADDSEKSKPSHPDVVDVTDQFLQEKDGVKTQTQQKLEQQEPVVQQQQSGIPLVQDGSEHQQQSGTPLCTLSFLLVVENLCHQSL
jgi:hypothetical protein